MNSKTIPPWLKIPLKANPTIEMLKANLSTLGLATVCQEARCPNLHECWSEGTATLMLMGDTCTRGCRFCHVNTAKTPGPLDPNEPAKVAQTVAAGGWHYVVLTSVDRDDLPDEGVAHWIACLQAIALTRPDTLVEALIPDYSPARLAAFLNGTTDPSQPTGLRVLAHNLETVERLTPSVRDRRAGYARSLAVLRQAKVLAPQLVAKSSLMLGLGETEAEVRQALVDLGETGVEVVTLGQYLQPSAAHLPVARYVPPTEFAYWKQVAEIELGFAYCASGPLVRSSYKAAEAFLHRRISSSV
jgi:lipoyl synthase